MKDVRRCGIVIACLLALNWASPAASQEAAEPLVVAVASNFRTTAEKLVQAFEAEQPVSVRLVSASSGQLFAQISNGAPFDVFLAADIERPRELEAQGLLKPGSRFTYAIGQLVLWSGDPRFESEDCEAALKDGDYRRLAIANPELAPYGRAAREYLQNLGAWEQAEGRLATGENISQALQFVATGNADLGLLALPLVSNPVLPASTCNVVIPAGEHAPIVQQGGLVQKPSLNPAASDFVFFVRSSAGRELIAADGYRLMSEIE